MTVSCSSPPSGSAVSSGSGIDQLRGRQGREKALQGMADLLKRGVPGLLAVDGPLGPRNIVHRGVAELACDTAPL